MSMRWLDLRPGCQPSPRRLGPVTRTDIVRYQGASGDMNPIHHDELFAREAGYAAPLVVGMYPAGVLAVYATDWLGAERLRRLKIRWKAQIWPGDVLTMAATLERTYDEGGEPKADIELTATKQDGTVAIQAWATFSFQE